MYNTSSIIFNVIQKNFGNFIIIYYYIYYIPTKIIYYLIMIKKYSNLFIGSYKILIYSTFYLKTYF